MLKFLFLVACITIPLEVASSEIGRTVRLIGAQDYFYKLMQELVYDLEDRQWCNFKADDLSLPLNDLTHTNVRAQGTATFTNGFLSSIHKVDTEFANVVVGSSNQNNVTVTNALVRGRLFFREAAVGFDVAVNLTNEATIRTYTGVFTHLLIDFRFDVNLIMNNRDVTVTGTLMSLSGGSGVRMVFAPTDEISQLLSLRFTAASNFDNASRWVRTIMAPMVREIALSGRVPFPEYCFNC